MRVVIDGKGYHLYLKNMAEVVRAAYDLSKDNLQYEGLNFSKGSILRTTLKSAFIHPFVLPALRKMYASKGIVLDKPDRHTDVIDYCVHLLCDFICLTEEDYTIDVQTVENCCSDDRDIETFSTSFFKRNSKRRDREQFSIRLLDAGIPDGESGTTEEKEETNSIA